MSSFGSTKCSVIARTHRVVLAAVTTPAAGARGRLTTHTKYSSLLRP